MKLIPVANKRHSFIKIFNLTGIQIFFYYWVHTSPCMKLKFPICIVKWISGPVNRHFERPRLNIRTGFKPDTQNIFIILLLI
ncbi:hypothetical protein BJB45_18550 [Halomonas huangheensis]|uniref:Uncharacterized protein n=1 Tax=Halomonas huangheensis TaxID=1178482 RepID=W1NCR1_9GAMM|nr:hypothetical protein AR456_11385 [Halomonas huangheensis]ERL53273.1 hypothetical protein BJB45_18550 [Halomonas huangheensis]